MSSNNGLYYSKADRQLAKQTFFENDEMLFLLRDVFYGFPLDKTKQALIKKTFTPELRELMRKTFWPEIKRDSPIGSARDMWSKLGIIAQRPETVEQMIVINQTLTGFVLAGLARLSKPTAESDETIDYNANLSEEALYGTLAGRNSFIEHVESRLIELQALAAYVEPDEETETQNRRKNSSE